MCNGSIEHLLGIYANKPVRIDVAEQIMHYPDLHKALKDMNIKKCPRCLNL